MATRSFQLSRLAPSRGSTGSEYFAEPACHRMTMTASRWRGLGKFTFVSDRCSRVRACRASTYVVALLLLLATLTFSSRPMRVGAVQSSGDSPADPLLVTRAGLSQYVYVLWSASCGSLVCFRLERLDGS